MADAEKHEKHEKHERPGAPAAALPPPPREARYEGSKEEPPDWWHQSHHPRPPAPYPIWADPRRRERAQYIVTHYSWWSIGWGFIPLPLVDVAAVSTVQYVMVSKLSNLYQIPFSWNRGKAIIAALVGGIVPISLARGLSGGLLRSIPVVGGIASFLTTPAFDGASTYAVGKIFVEHFESGGTFLDFNADDWREQYQYYLREGRDRFTNAEAPAQT